MSSATPVLAVEDLAVHFALRGGRGATTRAVDGVSLTIARGETLGLVGESGCGKSTVSNAAVGLVRPTRGSIRINGEELVGSDRRTLDRLRRQVQMVFQDPVLSLNPRMTVGAAIGEPLLVRRVARGRALSERVDRLLAAVGLMPEHARRYPHQFSGGQRQRVVIARALALEPALVICDEPVSALDVSVRAQILNLLVELQQRLGMAYLFVSHDLAVVRHISDRVAVMYLGRLVEVASQATLYGAPKHPYTKALMAAVPEPDPAVQRAKRRAIPTGELPSPMEHPSGCAFHARCPLATELCHQVSPALSPRPDGALVACHHA
jgi:oligopeptide transport system ATP-binding protein